MLRARRRLPFLFASILVLFVLFPVCSAFADVRDGDLIDGVAFSSTRPEVSAPDVLCDYCALVTSDGKYLYERDSSASVPIASITKIMTCILAIKEGDLDSTVTCSAAVGELGQSYLSSNAGLEEGDTARLGDLLYPLMLPSGNDAALAIAEHISGSESAFVDLMNEKAASLGMTDTHFVSCNGYTGDYNERDDNYSSARDLAKLCTYAMGDENFRKIVGTAHTSVIISGEEAACNNTNQMLEMYSGCIGIKTGATDDAGMCLTAAAQKDGVELYAVILHSGPYEDGSMTRFEDAATLFDWGFSHYRTVHVMDADTQVARIPLQDWIDRTIAVNPASDVDLLLFEYEDDPNLTLDLVVDDSITGDINVDDILGELAIYSGDTVVARVDLEAAESSDAPGFFQKAGTGISRFFKKLFKKPLIAETEWVIDQDVSLDSLFKGEYISNRSSSNSGGGSETAPADSPSSSKQGQEPDE